MLAGLGARRRAILDSIFEKLAGKDLWRRGQSLVGSRDQRPDCRAWVNRKAFIRAHADSVTSKLQKEKQQH
jgi:hypothetical protein